MHVVSLFSAEEVEWHGCIAHICAEGVHAHIRSCSGHYWSSLAKGRNHDKGRYHFQKYLASDLNWPESFTGFQDLPIFDWLLTFAVKATLVLQRWPLCQIAKSQWCKRCSPEIFNMRNTVCFPSAFFPDMTKFCSDIHSSLTLLLSNETTCWSLPFSSLDENCQTILK